LSERKSSPATDPAVQDLIRRKARKLSRHDGFHDQDLNDLTQALLTGLLGRLAGLDPQREHAVGFLARLINQVAANLQRESQAAKRDRRKVRSLSTPVGGDNREGAERVEAVTQEDCDRRTGSRTRSSQELSDLKADIGAVIERLPPLLRDLAQQLMEGKATDVARSTGTPPTTLRYRLRQLREVFERENLREYL
jgi:RNA polymerase sigma factor (sigma-70 family)